MNRHLAWLVERERGGCASPACLSGLGKTGEPLEGQDGELKSVLSGAGTVTKKQARTPQTLPDKTDSTLKSVLSGALRGVSGGESVTTQRPDETDLIPAQASAGREPDALVDGLGKTGEAPLPDCREPKGADTSAAQQQRITSLQAAGLSQDEARALAARLGERDAEGDWSGMAICLECRHCNGRRGGWWCAAYRAAGSSAPALGQDFPLMLKRCRAFAPALAGEPHPVRQAGT